MSEIKYWRIETTSAGSPFHNAHPDGDMVRRCDYESLERQLSEVRGELEARKEANTRMGNELFQRREDVANQATTIDTLRSELERATVRKVLEETKIINDYHVRLDALSVGWTAALEEFEFRINECWTANPCKEPIDPPSPNSPASGEGSNG